MTRRNRPNAGRRIKAADARRATVLNLLARLDRGKLTTDERQLLRDAITADHAALDTARQAQREHGTAMRRQAAQLDAAHDAIQEAEQAAADAREQLRIHRAVEEQRQADRATRRPSLATWWAATAAERRAPHIRQFLAEQTAHLPPELSAGAEVCCVCGHGPVAYHNYREQPFCWPCADGQPAPTTSTPEPQP